jgi:4-hydroxyphenylpyruvate dioxygenase
VYFHIFHTGHRKHLLHGSEGFGEGNFQALFESIELDQIRRGVLDGSTQGEVNSAAQGQKNGEPSDA